MKKSSQPSWPMRWASPSTPASLRMMSWSDLIVVESDTRWGPSESVGVLVELGLELAYGFGVLGAAAEALDEFGGGAESGDRVDLEHGDVLDGVDALIGVLVEQRVQHSAGGVAVLGENVALADAARSRRVSGGWSNATWQIRSKASMSWPTLSSIVSISTPFSSSSSTIACLRSDSAHRFTKSSSEVNSSLTVRRV